MASLLSFAKSAVNTVKNDVVAPVQRTIVNPALHDVSSAYNGVLNNVAKIPVVGKPLVAVDRGIVNTTSNIPRVLGDIGNTSLQDALHGNNNPATRNAMAARNRAETQFGSTWFRPLVQGAESIVHPFSQHTYTPTPGNAQRLLGKAPIQNINKGVNSTYQHGRAEGESPLVASLRGGLYGFGQAAQDVGTVAGLEYGVTGASSAAKASLSKLTPLDENGYLQIPGGDKLSPADYRVAVKQKLGDAMNDHNAQPKNYGSTGNGKTSSMTATYQQNSKLFKEYAKNPDAFIDKYNLLPPAQKAAEAGVVKPTILSTSEATPVKAPLPSPEAKVASTPSNTVPRVAGKGNEQIPNVPEGHTSITANGYGTVNVPNHIVAGAQKVAQEASADHADFQAHLNKIASDLGQTHVAADVKKAETIAAKAHVKYGNEADPLSGVKDVVRGLVTVPDLKNVDSVIKSIGEKYPITRVKDSTEEGGLNNAGYKDIKVNVKLPSGHNGEVILTTPEMLNARTSIAEGGLGGHDLYDKYTDPSTGPAEKAAALAAMQKIYGDADRAATSRLASASEIGTPSSSILPAEKGSPVPTIKPLVRPPSVTNLATTSSSRSLKNSVLGDNLRSSTIPSTIEQSGAKVKPPAVGLKTRGLTKGIANSEEFSPGLQKAVSGSAAGKYAPFTDKAANQTTADFMKQPLYSATKQVLDTLKTNQTGGKLQNGVLASFGKQEVSNAGAVIKALDAKGNIPGAQAVHDALAEKLTNAGQIGQAASLIYNRTPEGLKFMAQRNLG